MKIFNQLNILVFGLLLLSITACNTMEGMGEDIQKGGENLEDAAQKHK